MNERARLVSEMMDDARPMEVGCIKSNSRSRPVQRAVTPQVEAIPTDYTAEDIIIFITHEAMKLASFESFAGHGWTIWIDEVPGVLDHDKHRLFVTWEKLAEFYDLHPDGDGKWSRVTLRDPTADVARLGNNDECQQVLSPFHRRVADPRREVLVDLTAWEELAEKGSELSWYSVWSPAELVHFDRVVMLGNDLTHSMSYHIWQQKWPEITWQPITGHSPSFLPRKVTITYYAEGHRASRALFNSKQGQSNLAKIAYDIAYRVPKDQHIWTCNEADKDSLFRMPSERLSPKKAGSNAYAWATHVSAIYTAKPDPALIGVYKKLGIDPDLHTVSAELETILQFVCRSAIRKASDQSPVHIRVYDRRQAEYLMAYFARDPRGYVWAELEERDLGFLRDVRDSKPGRPPTPMTAAERTAKAERDRIKDRDRKRAERAAMKAALASR